MGMQLDYDDLEYMSDLLLMEESNCRDAKEFSPVIGELVEQIKPMGKGAYEEALRLVDRRKAEIEMAGKRAFRVRAKIEDMKQQMEISDLLSKPGGKKQ